MKILIVEDDKDYAFLEQEILEEAFPGCQIATAYTGEDCLTRNLSDYDVILLDYHLPDTPGIELIPKILNCCDVPVVMVTGVQEVETVVEALKRGAYNYTVKSQETLTLLPAIIEKTVEEYKRKQKNKVLEQQLLESEKMASIGRLTAGIAHEFNNVLQGMLGYATLGKDSDNLDEMKEAFEVLLKSCQRAKSIVTDLLTFAKPQPAQRELFDVTEALENSLALMKKEFEKFNIQLEQRFSKVPRILCEPGQLSQVFLNLLTNARDAINEKGGLITISLCHENGYINIKFSDTGCGIPKEIQKKIFEPFFTTKGARSGSAVKGTGLGLAVSYSIVRNHGGIIEVESEIGVGTTFTIRLPVITSEQEESKMPTQPVVPQQNKEALDILVVDDEEVIRTILERLLSKEGHHVTTTADGVSALQLLPEKHFDLIFSDISMPRMSGIEFLEKVKSLNSKAKVVMITGQIIDTDLEWAQKKGAWGYLRKPFQKADLNEIIQKAMQRL